MPKRAANSNQDTTDGRGPGFNSHGQLELMSGGVYDGRANKRAFRESR